MEDYKSNDYAEKEIELVEEAYVYLTSKKYPNGCSDNRKRIIRKKSQKFLIESGELFYKQKQKGKVKVSKLIICTLAVLCLILFRYQMRSLKSPYREKCFSDISRPKKNS